MNRSRRVRGQPFDYDPRIMGGPGEQRPPPPDYDDPYVAHGGGGGPPFEPVPPPQAGPPYNDPHYPHQQYPMSYRDQRLPSAYRATSREPPAVYPPPSSAAPYNILCITNINPKVADGQLKDVLTSDFERFGDISVKICHVGGERWAYIYFRTYEEAREARYAKIRTMLFDRPIEIEPIYEMRTSPVMDPPSPGPLPPGFPSGGRARSITPPEYYGNNVLPPPLPGANRRAAPPPPPMSHHHRGLSPPPQSNMSYPPHPSSRHGPPGPSMAPSPPMPYSRYYLPSTHMGPISPYSSPPHEPHPYRSYHPMAHQSSPYPPPHGAGYPPPSMYGPPPRERERLDNLARSPRHESYYPPLPMEPRAYPPPSTNHHHHSSSRTSSSIHSSATHHYPDLSPSMTHHHSSSSSKRRSPPQSDNPPPARYLSREFRREKYGSENYNHNEPEDGRPSRVLFINNVDSTKTEAELREVFNEFGTIEEIETRKISADISSVLIKFSSMDCAYKAKTATNGKYLGSFKCRISYGKVSASRRLWVGGFGPTTTMACLEDEFGKFGNIINLDYISGRPYAYIEYESANQAQFATHHLKGTFVAEAERRIRIEYVDPVERNVSDKPDSGVQKSDSVKSHRTNESWSNSNEHGNDGRISSQASRIKRSLSPETIDIDISTKRLHQGLCSGSSLKATLDSDDRLIDGAAGTATNISAQSTINSPNEGRSTTSSEKNELNNNQDRSDVSAQQQNIDTDVAGQERKADGEKDTQERTLVSQELEHLQAQDESNDCDSLSGLNRLIYSRSIRDIVNCCSVSWFGQLVLRNFHFPSKIYMCGGRKATIENYLSRLNGSSNGDQCPILRITQRWRLHPQPKLEEVKRRMQSGNLGMLIITSRASQLPSVDPSSPARTQNSSTSQQGGMKQNGDINHGTESTSIDSERQADKSTGSDVTSNDATTTGNASPLTQSRPLKNLISYLEQKDAAGVISLDSDQSDGPKLLYTFPPGDFAHNLLKRKAPKLTDDSMREEFLLGVIVGGAEGKV